MNQDDSDYQVCLTSSEYNRILLIQKQCNRQRDQFISTKKQFLTTISHLKQQILKLQTLTKTKTNEIDQLSVECLRLKKIRITQEDQIRNLKEDKLREKELYLSQFEFSVKENNDFKERITVYEGNVRELKECIVRLKSQNGGLNERMVAKGKEYEGKIEKLEGELEQVRKELQDSQKRATYFDKKSNDLDSHLKKSKQTILSLTKQIQRLSMVNQESIIKHKDDLQQHANMKSTLEMKLKIVKQEEDALAKQKQIQVAKLNQQSIRLSQLLIDANKKIEEYMLKEKNGHEGGGREQGENKGEGEKYSSKIYQAIEWAKDGILSSEELKQQISNILSIQKSYQQIIQQNNLKISSLQLQLQSLRQANPNQHPPLKNNELLNENMIFKYQLDKLKQKYSSLNHTLESTVKTYNQTIIEMQMKFEKEIEEYRDAHHELEAIRIGQEYEKYENLEGAEMFQKELEGMRGKGALNVEEVMKVLRRLFPKLEKV